MYLPNLELMKLYSYLKDRGELVKLIEHPEDEYPKASTIYLRAEHQHSPILDDWFYEHDDIHLGGAFFTKRKYVPFKNIEIEAQHPSYRLYIDFIKRVKPSRYFHPQAFIDYNYLRFNSPAEYQWRHFNRKRPFYIYDEDLLSSGNFARVSELMKYDPLRIGFNHAFIIDNEKDFQFFKDVYNDIGSKKFQATMTRLRLLWPKTLMGVKTLYAQEQKFFNSFGTNGIEVPLILDNFQKIQYNIIEGIKKYAFIASQGKHPLIWYLDDVNNPYNLFCNFITEGNWRQRDYTGVNLINAKNRRKSQALVREQAIQLIQHDVRLYKLMALNLIELRGYNVV